MGDLLSLLTGDDPAAWAALGFRLRGDCVRLGGVRVRCDGAGGGIRDWSFGAAEISEPARKSAHPNGARAVDHVVLLTDDVDRSVADAVALGGDERRRAGPPQVPVPMAFVRLGEVIVEVAQADGPPRLWGLVAVVDDLAALAARLGERLGAPKDAVQPGRRIATVRPAAGLATALAFMTPR